MHARKVKLAADADLDRIAASTAGFSGADLANLVNEAALLATRRGAEAVSGADFAEAIERLIAGLEKKNRVLNEQERRVVAHHELGHALVAMALPGTDPVQKISIIPRGVAALGYTLQRPTEDRFLMTREELENKMAVLLGGRAAEEVMFDHRSTGPSGPRRYGAKGCGRPATAPSRSITSRSPGNRWAACNSRGPPPTDWTGWADVADKNGAVRNDPSGAICTSARLQASISAYLAAGGSRPAVGSLWSCSDCT